MILHNVIFFILQVPLSVGFLLRIRIHVTLKISIENSKIVRWICLPKVLYLILGIFLLQANAICMFSYILCSGQNLERIFKCACWDFTSLNFCTVNPAILQDSPVRIRSGFFLPLMRFKHGSCIRIVRFEPPLPKNNNICILHNKFSML